MMMALFAGIFIVLFLIGTPIAVALGATSLFNMEVFDTIAVSSFTKTASNGFNSYLLVACPLFTFAGDIMAKGGISKRLIAVAKLLIGNCVHFGLYGVCCDFRHRLRNCVRHRYDYDP